MLTLPLNEEERSYPQRITLNDLHEAWQLSGQLQDEQEPVASAIVCILVRELGVDALLALATKYTA
jgi:hypothetical protein